MKKALTTSIALHGVAVAILCGIFSSRTELRPSNPSISISGIGFFEHQASKSHISTGEKKITSENEETVESEVTGKGASTTPEISSGTGENTYFSELQRRIQAEERYPLEAQKRKIESDVTVGFELNEKGEVVEIHVISLEKPQILQEAAITAVHAASPFPAPPPGISKKFQISIEFRLSNVKKDLL